MDNEDLYWDDIYDYEQIPCWDENGELSDDDDIKRCDMEFTIKEEPFSWNDNFSEIALEDFSMIQEKLPYGICQSIGMALAKLKLLEEQGCKVEEMKDDN